MRKRTLIQSLCKQFPDLPPHVVAAMSNTIFDMIIQALADGRRVEIRNFGTFYLSNLPMRMLRNPRNGELMEVPARRLPRFKTGKQLRNKVNDN